MTIRVPGPIRHTSLSPSPRLGGYHRRVGRKKDPAEGRWEANNVLFCTRLGLSTFHHGWEWEAPYFPDRLLAINSR